MKKILIIGIVILIGIPVSCKFRPANVLVPRISTTIDHAQVRSFLEGAPSDPNLETDETMAEVKIPVLIAEDFLRASLVGEVGEAPGVLSALDAIKVSHIDHSVTFGGRFPVPESLKVLLDNQFDREVLKKDLSFQFSVIPTITVQDNRNYLKLKFLSFKINRLELVQTFPIVSYFIMTLLESSQISALIKPRADKLNKKLEGIKLAVQPHELILEKQVDFFDFDRTIRIEIRPDQLVDFSKYYKTDRIERFVQSLRLWSATPLKFMGTDDDVFFFALGVGRPSKKWQSRLAERLDRDAKLLIESKSEEIAAFSDYPQIDTNFRALFSDYQTDFPLAKLSLAEKDEIATFWQEVDAETRQTLSEKNSLFQLSPQEEYQTFRADVSTRMVLFLESLTKRQQVSAAVRESGSASGSQWPFLIQHISQNTLSQLARQLRDTKINESYLFTDLGVKIDPFKSQIRLHGKIRIDLNKILPTDLQRTDGQPFRAHRGLFGDSIPFSLGLLIHFQADSWIRLEMAEGQLFSGDQAIDLKSYQQAGETVMRMLKISLMQLLVNTRISLPAENISEQISKEQERRISNIKGRLQQLPNQVELLVNGQHGISEKLLQLLQENVAMANVYNETRVEGEEVDKEIAEIIRFEQGIIYFNLKPSFLFPDLFRPSRDIHFWNLAPTYSESLKNNFLEVALGTGPRSKTYVDYLLSRKEAVDTLYQADASLAGEGQGKAVDLRTYVGLSNLSSLITKVLVELKDEVNKEIEANINQRKEQTYVRINSMKLTAQKNGSLLFSTVLSLIEKQQRSVFNPARWVGTTYLKTTDTVSVQVHLFLKRQKLEEVKKRITLRPNEVLFGDQIMVLDLSRSVIKTWKYLSFLKILKVLDFATLTIFDLKNLLQKIVFSKFASLVDNPEDEGNTVISDVHLNRYLKILLRGNEMVVVLNPKFLSQGVEILPASIRPEDEGDIVHYANNMMQLDYRSHMVISDFDQRKLSTIAQQINAVFMPLDQKIISSLEFLNQTLPWEKLLGNPQAFQEGLFTEFQGVFDYYQQDSHSNTTECSLGSMLLAATAGIMGEKLEGFLQMVKEKTLTDSQAARVQSLNSRLLQIKDAIKLLLNSYEGYSREKNSRIIKRAPTDWNFRYFKEAVFADAIYHQLKATE